jgi:tetratricopeptide (TPR) repeat protein
MRCVSLTKDGGVGWEIEHVRLFRNDPDIRYRYRIHEQVVGARSVAPTGIRLVHTGYVDPRAMPAKLERNLHLIDLDLAERPFDGRLLYYRGATLLDLERADEAVITLQIAEPLLERGSEAGRWHALAFARALRAVDHTPHALDVIRAARVLLPTDLDLAVMEAQLLIDLGDVGGAGSKLAAVLDRNDRDLTLNHIAGWTLLGEIHLALDQFEAAREIGRLVTDKRPTWGDGWLLYADALLALGETTDLDTVVERLGRMKKAGDVCTMVAAATLVRAGEHGQASTLLEPCTDPLAARLRSRIPSWSGGPLLSGLRRVTNAGVPSPTRVESRPIPRFEGLQFEGATP